MQSGRSTTEPHAHFIFHRKMTNYKYKTNIFNHKSHVTAEKQPVSLGGRYGMQAKGEWVSV
jgi:hypothetical protein